ncbi:MAG: hypothetical protein LBC13_02020 [Clostridiales bacterium]|nr:hypothetical protein [Clostridiales bacterium]
MGGLVGHNSYSGIISNSYVNMIRNKGLVSDLGPH